MSEFDLYSDVSANERENRDRLRARIEALVSRVTYRKGYNFFVGVTPGMKYPFLQVRHWREDSMQPGKFGWGHGGKTYVTVWSTDSEIFQTIFGLAKSYEEHEVRETLLVDGKRPFGPHIDTQALCEVADRLDVRS